MWSEGKLLREIEVLTALTGSNQYLKALFQMPPRKYSLLFAKGKFQAKIDYVFSVDNQQHLSLPHQPTV